MNGTENKTTIPGAQAETVRAPRPAGGGERSFGGGGGGYRGDRGDRDDRGGGMDDDKRGGRGGFGRKKVCRFCVDRNAKVDFKDQATLKYFVTERGKIIPRRISGNCAKHQRAVAVAIKRARGVALIPYQVLMG